MNYSRVQYVLLICLSLVAIFYSVEKLLKAENPQQTSKSPRYFSIAQKNNHSQSNFSWISGYSDGIAWFLDNKFRILGSTATLGYIGLQGYICSLEYAIQNQRWSAWNQEYTLEKLYALSDAILQKELLTDIKRTYPAARNDYATSFLAFLDAIKQEENEILHFQSIIASVNFLKLTLVISYNQQLVTQCQRRLEQLQYLRNRLINTFIK